MTKRPPKLTTIPRITKSFPGPGSAKEIAKAAVKITMNGAKIFFIFL